MKAVVKSLVLLGMVGCELFGMENASILSHLDACFVSSYYQKAKALNDSFITNYCAVALPDIIKLELPDRFVVEDYTFNKIDDLIFARDNCLIHAGFYNMFDAFGDEIVFEVDVAFCGHGVSSEGFLKIGFAAAAARVGINIAFFEFSESMVYFTFTQTPANCEQVFKEVFDRLRSEIWDRLNPNQLDEILSKFSNAVPAKK